MIRLLIADDSPVFRHFLRKCVAQMDGVDLIGEARHGEDALVKIANLEPDVITLDMTMPRMNGMQALQVIRQKYPNVKAIVLTREDEEEAGLTVEALEAGAFDFIFKPDVLRPGAEERLVTSLYPRLQAACNGYKARLKTLRPTMARRGATMPANVNTSVSGSLFLAPIPDVIAIGASTGGPAALHRLLSALPASLNVPIVLTQHMPKAFLVSLVERLERETALTCQLAGEGMILKSGHIYVAPGEVHLEVDREGMNLVCHLVNAPPVHHCRPAVDPMFISLSVLAPRTCTLAVVLTGMGEDGAAGAKAIREAKGFVLAQDQESSVVWGMPGATVKNGAAHEVLPLEDIAPAITLRCSRNAGLDRGGHAVASV